MNLVTYFEKFISNIQPTDERIKAASEAHNDLRDYLTQGDGLDIRVADSFLSGSYGRSTAVDPIKDVDIILILEGREISDDRTIPSPKTILANLKADIDKFYDEVNLETQRRSIQVNLPEDEIFMDLVPAIAPKGKEKKLWVPDREQAKWIESHPYGHLAFARDLNAASAGNFVKVAKAIKWWKGLAFDTEMAPKSFLIESIVASNLEKNASNLCQVFEGTLEKVLTAYRANYEKKQVPFVADPGLPEADLAKSFTWTWDQFKCFFDTLAGLHSIAVKANSEATTKERTIELWRGAFGDRYPSSLDDEAKQHVVTGTPARPGFRFRANISAALCREKGGEPVESYPSNGRRLSKKWWLKFQLESTDVPTPYEIKWQVINHGAEARQKGQLRHHAYPGSPTQWESTEYRGRHFMDCEIIKDGNVVARTRYRINIK